MASAVDPNDVLMAGENSFIRFSPDGGKTQTDRVSHWRVLWCPAGAGHVVFMQCTLTGGAASAIRPAPASHGSKRGSSQGRVQT